HTPVFPSLTPPPHGCFYNRQSTSIACPAGTTADECFACKKTLVCLTTEPRPSITCIPKPPCANGGMCQLTDGIHWCPSTEHAMLTPGSENQNSSSSSSAVSSQNMGSWWNSFL